MYVCTCVCAGEHRWQFPLVFLWPAAKTYSWRLPKLEPAVEVCVRLHAGTYVRMSMAVGWPKGNSLVYLHKWHTLIMHYLTCSCTQTSFTIFLHFFVRIQVENDTIMYYVCFLYTYIHSEVFLMCDMVIHTVPVHMQVIPSNRPTADKLLIHDFFSSWLQTS